MSGLLATSGYAGTSPDQILRDRQQQLEQQRQELLTRPDIFNAPKLEATIPGKQDSIQPHTDLGICFEIKSVTFTGASSLSYQDLDNHQHTDASSTSIGISAGNGSTLLSNVMSNLAANTLGNAGLPKNNDESSQTQSVISPASVTIRSGDAQSKTAGDTLTARDACTANGALSNSLTLQ